MDKIVLIIDDDNMLRNTLARGLRNEEFHVLTADSAEQGERILSRIRVDAIILDRMMVGKDGLTFLQELRKNGNNTPVIMLTAMTGPDNAIDGLSCGANDYLSKPFKLRELILRINNIITINSDDAQFNEMPNGLKFIHNEFFVVSATGTSSVLALSGEEKKLLRNLTTPLGNIVPAAPMVAKRLRNKINVVLSNLDIITVRGHGYKLVTVITTNNKNGEDK